MVVEDDLLLEIDRSKPATNNQAGRDLADPGCRPDPPLQSSRTLRGRNLPRGSVRDQLRRVARGSGGHLLWGKELGVAARSLDRWRCIYSVSCRSRDRIGWLRRGRGELVKPLGKLLLDSRKPLPGWLPVGGPRPGRRRPRQTELA